MSDANPQSIGTAQDREGPAGRPDDEGRSAESWIDRLMTAVGLKPSASALRESLEMALSREAGEDKAFSAEERAMIRNILRLRETRVWDVMVPRSEVDAVAMDITLTELMIRFRASGHSRMPVYRETLDDAGGMVHIRDLMAYIAEQATVPASRVESRAEEAVGIHLSQVDLARPLSETGIVRPVLFVPASVPAADLLARMQQSRIQMALVIDEYGGVDGLVSLEDLLETVVGDIEDEHDIDEGGDVVPAPDGNGWIAHGKAELDDVSAATGIDFELWDESDDVDTLGGFAIALVGRVPSEGETITSEKVPGIAFDVIDADARRIRSLRIRRTVQRDAAAAESGDREAGAA
jgi:CBS domain containing-hemolysin-like protein